MSVKENSCAFSHIFRLLSMNLRVSGFDDFVFRQAVNTIATPRPVRILDDVCRSLVSPVRNRRLLNQNFHPILDRALKTSVLSSTFARQNRALPLHPWSGRGSGDCRPPRFIPARAGNAVSPTDLRASTAVHPRASGERTVKMTVGNDRIGSSPRERGTQRRGRRASQHWRFIPARAGNAAIGRRSIRL